MQTITLSEAAIGLLRFRIRDIRYPSRIADYQPFKSW